MSLKVVNGFKEGVYRSISIDINNTTVDDDILEKVYEEIMEVVSNYLDYTQYKFIVA